MKTERRHELQTNILADWLGHKTEAIRPYFKLILGGIAAVLIVAIVATVASWRSMWQDGALDSESITRAILMAAERVENQGGAPYGCFVSPASSSGEEVARG